jgi:peptidoglycan/LPS O-acetylase OafA/YrhL
MTNQLESSAALPSSDLRRFLFIDGLRGVAAMMVVIVHIRGALAIQYGAWLPAWLDHLLALGRLGVDIFFVLSGYVIAFSIRNGTYTFSYLGRFAAKRSVRLDPTYWCAIAAEIAMIWLAAMLYPQFAQPQPSPSTVVAHLFYAQDLLGLGNINPVFWTLCIEVQFYVFFVSALVFLQRFRESARTSVVDAAASVLAAALFAYSICVFFGFVPNPHPGLFIERWWQFFVGVLAWRSSQVLRIKPEFPSALAVLAAAWLVSGFARYEIVIATALTSSLIVAAVLKARMNVWLSSAPMQFLGRISYSLYLFHAIVGWRFARLLSVSVAPTAGPWLVALLFAVSLAMCVLASWVAYRLIERPTLLLSKSVRLDRPLRFSEIWRAWREQRA